MPPTYITAAEEPSRLSPSEVTAGVLSIFVGAIDLCSDDCNAWTGIMSSLVLTERRGDGGPEEVPVSCDEDIL